VGNFLEVRRGPVARLGKRGSPNARYCMVEGSRLEGMVRLHHSTVLVDQNHHHDRQAVLGSHMLVAEELGWYFQQGEVDARRAECGVGPKQSY
jgi:hypothetical protein